MKKADDAIESVMVGLRGAEAAPGLEGRVRDGVRRRMAEREARGGRVGAFGFGWRWVAFGLGSLAVLLVVALSTHRAEKRSAVVANSGDVRNSVAQTNRASTGIVNESVPQRLKPRSRRLGGGTDEPVPLSKAASVVAASGGGIFRDEAVSFPAPPLPLTEQERLLLRVANHSGPEEVAMLDPVARAMWDVEETAVFLDFFGRPVSAEQTIQKVNQGESR